jgi:hypothetical protein
VNPTEIGKTGEAKDRSQAGPTDAKQTELAVRGGVIETQLPDRGTYPRKLDEAAVPSRGATSPDRRAQKSEVVGQPTEMDRQAISDLLSRYKAAYELKDMDGIRAVFPTINGPEESAALQNFRLAKTIQLILNITDIQVAGDSARATVAYTITATFNNNQTASSGINHMEFDLRKADGSWIIQRIIR